MIISVPFLWMTEYTQNPNQCFLNMSKNDLAYVFCFNVLLIILPTVGLIILYLMIILKLKKRNISLGNIKDLKPMNSNSSSSLSTPKNIKKNLYNNNRRFTITISIVSVVFYCCQLPTRFFLCWSYANDRIEIIYANIDSQSLESFSSFSILSHTFNLIYFLHCVSNPIIYNLMSTKFSRSFRNVVLCNYINYKKKKASFKSIYRSNYTLNETE